MGAITNLHHIRKHILRTLAQSKWARFRDLRPNNVDSNLYNYHLRKLIRDGFIERDEQKGYRLSPTGLRYVDHVSLESFEPRWQPKVITVFLTKNDRNQYLMWSKYRQPFIGKFSLPSGKIHYEDESLAGAMNRELSFFLTDVPDVTYAGVMEYRAFINAVLVTHTIAHVFSGNVTDHQVKYERLVWRDISELKPTDMSPGTPQTIRATEKHQGYFYERHDINW